MKYYKIIILIILGITGYIIYFNQDKIFKKDDVNDIDVKIIKKENNDIVENPITYPQINMNIYKNYKNEYKRKKVTYYEQTWKYHEDISSFEVLFTNNEEIQSKKFKDLFYDFYNEYDNISNYKIGYKLNITINNENKTIDIKSPKDTNILFDYLEVYLYDDINQIDNNWYSHINENEINDNTLLTSIKLTSGVNINNVSSPIILTVYLYDKNNTNYVFNETSVEIINK